MRGTTEALMQKQKESAPVATLRNTRDNKCGVAKTEPGCYPNAQAGGGETESEVVDGHSTETNTISLSLNKVKESTATTMGTTVSSSYSKAHEQIHHVIPREKRCGALDSCFGLVGLHQQ